MKQKIWLKIKINKNKDPNKVIRSLNKGFEDVDRYQLLLGIIRDRGKIITELNEEIKHLTAQIVTLRYRCEEQEKNINKLSKEYKALSKFHENEINYTMELEKLLQRNHISYFALRQKTMDNNTEVAKEYDIKHYIKPE